MQKSLRASGREFSLDDIKLIKREILLANPPLRAEIARRVCHRLNWRDDNGEFKTMSCRVALLKLNRKGYIELPPPRNGNGNKKGLRTQLITKNLDSTSINCSVELLKALHLQRVETRADSALWNSLIDQYHYLGYQRLPGAQVRYLIRDGQTLLGALGFGAAAWCVAARDHWIGWDSSMRQNGLKRVVNNARFLILPWIRCPNLASKVLALSEHHLKEDFASRYGITPVLLETFVEQRRFRGTCYRAANWQHVGQTKGRGKCDRDHHASLPIKDIYLKPLTRDFRTQLGATS